MAVRHNVRTMRERMALSLDDFAEKVGVTTRTIQSWELGEHDPSPMAILHLKRVWGEHVRSTKMQEPQSQQEQEPQSQSQPSTPIGSEP